MTIGFVLYAMISECVCSVTLDQKERLLMKNRILLSIAFLFLITIGVSYALSDEGEMQLYSPDDTLVTLYAEPDRLSAVIGQYYPTVEATVLNAMKENQTPVWYQIQIGGQIAYVPAENLRHLPPSVGSNWLWACIANKNFREATNIYESPDASKPPVYSVFSGYMVEVFGHLPDGWHHIQYRHMGQVRDRYGYVQLDFSELADVHQERGPEHPLYKNAYLDLNEAYVYSFEGEAPEQLAQAFALPYWSETTVQYGYISSWGGDRAVVAVKDKQDKSILCIVSETDGVWQIRADNATVVPPGDDTRIYVSFYRAHEMTFTVPWKNGYASCRVSDQGDDLWLFQSLMILGDSLGRSVNCDIYVSPTVDGLMFAGKLQRRGESDIPIDCALPPLDSYDFLRLDFGRLRTAVESVEEAYRAEGEKMKGEIDYVLRAKDAKTVDIHAQDNVDSPIIARYYGTVPVHILSSPEDAENSPWLHVDVMGTKGYIPSAAVSPATFDTGSDWLMTAIAQDAPADQILMYALPSLGADVTGRLTKGARIAVYGYLPDGWCRVDSLEGAGSGYILAQQAGLSD